MAIAVIVLIVLLVIACFMDYKYGKIYNFLIIAGMVAGCVHCIYQNGMKGILVWLGLFLLPVLITYPLYMIGVFGAGDVKLLAVAGGFLSFRSCFWFIFVSFLIGAVLSLVKMLYERNLKERICYFISYVWELCCLGGVRLYHSREMIGEQFDKKKQKIHFAGPILCSVLLHIGGIF